MINPAVDLLSQEVDRIYGMHTPEEVSQIKRGFPILSHKVTDLFLKAHKVAEESGANPLEDRLLVKVSALADAHTRYYNSVKFGFVYRFFSSLHNLFTLGKFESSASIASKLSHHLLLITKLDNAFHCRPYNPKLVFLRMIEAFAGESVKGLWETILKDVELDYLIKSSPPNFFKFLLSKEMKGCDPQTGREIKFGKEIVVIFTEEGQTKKIALTGVSGAERGFSGHIDAFEINGENVNIKMSKGPISLTVCGTSDQLRNSFDDIVWEK